MRRLIYLIAVFSTTVLGDACWRDSHCTGPEQAAFPGPWDENNFAPTSRIVRPRDVFPLADPQNVLKYDAKNVALDKATPALLVDFGLEVGGLVTFNYTLSGSALTCGLAFTEAKDFIGTESDSPRGDGTIDGAVYAQLDERGNGSYSMPPAKLRGGFRYLTLFVNSTSNSSLAITDLALELSVQPTWSDLRAYQGYFHSDDALLNKIWYAGAWTLQTNTIPGDCGLRTPDGDGWDNVEVLTDAETVLVDGAKRDRFIWNGDMGHGGSECVSYHLWNLIGTYNYPLYSGDVDFVTEIWPKYVKGMNHSLSLLTESGIVNVTGEDDWGRFEYSTERCSASMLLYRALETGATIASWIPDLSIDTNYTQQYLAQAKTLRKSILREFWDESTGAFTDSPGSNLHPQDANAMALAYNVVTDTQADLVSEYLTSQWTLIGPAFPELPNNISPFISSIELEGHFRAGRPDRALELIRSLWGWYIQHENGTQSTVPEGYHVNGSWSYREERSYTKGQPYVSHAHGWGAGPTSTLTEYMVGLRVTKPAGSEWVLSPGVSDRGSFEAGFSTSLGRFSARIVVEDEEVTVGWDSPEGTVGIVQVPGRDSVIVRGGKGDLVASL
ncbi:alpha-L-rhamnosidase B [Aspergillus steynii IBT 23096]|uniref:Alpha-L-rhamnosidase B n=1 Tax=Aspergillus steynii IBT 23096 TaxID=1392250 RepID=A0A2I2GFF4_9EURO|nr:alpha-L-rhamnosidase B [Aspergillus steynii IBT 23096]PLB51610.1 alpha-L-rhamnosidase B [Aspergillus steynii IBT 23096]